MRTAAVTGATGFIGGRLVEALATSRGVTVTALVRDYAHAGRVGRLGVRIEPVDLLELNSIRTAIDGVDVVFHCAYGWDPDDRAERTLNIEGGANVLSAALQQGVPRFVHVSTMAIYGHDLPELVDEDTTPNPTTPYGETKLEIENRLRELASGAELDLRVARATKVFGPYDYAFTARIAQALLENRLWLIGEGRGLVAPSYVDNLVEGLLLCAEVQADFGGTYVLADGLNLTWSEFYDYFCRMTGARPRGSFGPDGRPTSGVPAGDAEPDLESRPSEQEYRDYMRRGAYSIARAQRELGYQPKVSIDAAMARTEAWLRFAEILPSTPRSRVDGQS